MSNLLHLDTSIQADNSVSRRLSAVMVGKLEDALGSVKTTYRDLAASPLPHLSAQVFTSLMHPASVSGLNRAQQDDVEESARVLAEFLAADVIVIGVAFYNYSIPSSLKAWIDRVVVVGKTFSYDARGGAVGLAGGKRVVVVMARGGVFAKGSPNVHREHAERYLRDIFAFMGIDDVEVVVAEGLALGAEKNAAAVQKAMMTIDAIVSRTSPSVRTHRSLWRGTFPC